MAEFWTHDGFSWKKVQQPSGYLNGQWRDAKKAWVWDGASFSWVQVWTSEVEIPLFAGTGPVNLKSIFDGSQFAGTQPGRIVFRVVDNATIGTSDKFFGAIYVPDAWSWNPEIELRIGSGANVVGVGGDGGEGRLPESAFENLSDYDGKDGGSALLVRYPVRIENQGRIGGGGGGGGGAGGVVVDGTSFYGGGGAGGAGKANSSGGVAVSQIGTDFSGTGGSTFGPGDRGVGEFVTNFANENIAFGGRGGFAGSLGANGSDGDTGQDIGGFNVETFVGGFGGSVGPAIDGISNVTYISRGVIKGPEVN